MRWFLRLIRYKALERDLDKELQFHLDAATDDLVRSGLSRDEARRVARIEFGGVENAKEEARDARGTRWLTDWWTDTRYALRGFARSPAFSVAAILTLAVGIGANTAVWSILDALVRRALPVARAEELYALKRVGIDDDHYRFSHALMLRLRTALGDSTPIAGMAGIAGLYATIGDRPVPVLGQLVSANFFSLLGVRSQAGRLFVPDDDRTLGGGPVAVITDQFWERRFGRDPAVVGRTMRLNGQPMTVIGVLQPGFAGLTVGTAIDVFVPLVMQHELRYMSNASSDDADMRKPWIPQNGVSWLTLIMRAADSDRSAIAPRLAAPFRADRERQLADEDSTERSQGLRERVVLEPLSRGFSPLRQQFGDPLRALMASVGLILLLACANLAGLMLARSAARTHETAVRVSLGARPGRLVRQALTESVTLAAIGGALGLLVAYFTTRGLLRLASAGTRAIPLDASLDVRVLAFAFGITLLAGILFGLAPALRVSRADLHGSFKTGGRVVTGGGGSSHKLPLGRVLVMGQIALSLILVTSAALFVRTFQNLMRIEAGFERETLVTARLDVRAAGYTEDGLPALHERLLAAARAIPGVQSASLSMHGLGNTSQRIGGYMVPGRELAGGVRTNQAQDDHVTPDFFRTTGIQIVSGRGFTDRDTRDAPRVVVVSQATARHFFGTDSVIGRRFGYNLPGDVEIVGVVRDVRPNGLRTTPPRMVFRALAQSPWEYVTSLEVRVAGEPRAVIAPLRDALAAVDRNLPVRDVVVMDDLLARGLIRERLMARLSGAFGLLSLLLAGIGLFGVISYSVTRRKNEMGVRLALGASPATVRWVVLNECARTITVGLIAGLILWLPLKRFTERLVYGLSPNDPATVAVGMLLLLLVGLAAGLIPAVRASRIDPIEAIRSD